MRTRTVVVLADEFEDYVEWLASQAWPIVRTREVELGRFVEVTFAY